MIIRIVVAELLILTQPAAEGPFLGLDRPAVDQGLLELSLLQRHRPVVTLEAVMLPILQLEEALVAELVTGREHAAGALSCLRDKHVVAAPRTPRQPLDVVDRLHIHWQIKHVVLETS